MARQAAQFVGTIPENYDDGLGPHIFFGYGDDLARRVAALAPRRVLELAAGTGIVTRRLRDLLPDACQLVASDLNPPMLEVAKAKFPVDAGVTFEQADASALPFEDESFDVVVCQFGVMFFPDKDRAYGEALRVLQPGGRYLFNVWDSWAANPYARIVHEVVAGFFPDDPPGFYEVPFGYHDPDAIRAALQRAGFARAAVAPLSLTSKIPSAARFARGLVFGNPLYEEIVSRGGAPEAVCAAVATAIDQDLGAQMPLKAFVIQASKD